MVIVEDGALSGSHGPLRLIEMDVDAGGVAGWREGRLSGNVLVADFDLGAEWGGNRRDGNPVHSTGH